MLSLREIYSSLQKSDDTVDIVIVNPVSYIKLLKEFKEKEKIIFVSKIVSNFLDVNYNKITV